MTSPRLLVLEFLFMECGDVPPLLFLVLVFPLFLLRPLPCQKRNKSGVTSPHSIKRNFKTLRRNTPIYFSSWKGCRQAKKAALRDTIATTSTDGCPWTWRASEVIVNIPSPIAAAFLIASLFSAVASAQPIPDGTSEATKAIAKLKVPPGFKVDLWAAEPKLGNPVSFCINEKGLISVAEPYRFNRGTEEYRHRPFFLEGDLANTTVEARLAMYKKFQRVEERRGGERG